MKKPAHDDDIFVTEVMTTVPHVSLSLVGGTVQVNLNCPNAYYARVLYDDISSRMNSLQRTVIQFGGGGGMGTVEEEIIG